MKHRAMASNIATTRGGQMEKDKNCVFCSYPETTVVVYQDALCFAIVSTSPINQYHLLVIPKQHFVDFVDLPDDMAARIFLVAKRLSQAVRVVCQPDAVTHISDDDPQGKGFNLMSHYKFHIIPRFLDDRVRIDWGREEDPGIRVREGYAAQIKEALEAK
jgi:histidine triad (HIT) family protein